MNVDTMSVFKFKVVHLKITIDLSTFIIYDYTCNPSCVVFKKGVDYNPIKEIDLRFRPSLALKNYYRLLMSFLNILQR